MNTENILNSKNMLAIIFITIIVVIFGLIISIIQPPKYKSSAKLLVIFSQENTTPYASSQTSNYIASILGEVIYSDSFVNSIFKTNFDLDDSLGFNQEDKMKNWKRMVKTEIQENKGIIVIDVYHQNRDQANNFAQAISYTIITNHSLYHGSGNNVVVKMISIPTTPQNWTEPNITQNILFSLLAGIFIGLTFIIIFPEQELVNFIFRNKIISRDETIALPNTIEENNELHNETTQDIPTENPEVQDQWQEEENNNDNDNKYYNW